MTLARRAELGVFALAAAVAVVLVSVADPRRSGALPLCPLHALTGLDCPGCGSLRATRSLLDGDVGAALGYNAALVTLPLLVLATAAVVRRAGAHRAALLRRRLPFLALVGLVLWTVARNLPLAPLDRLAS